MKIERGEIWWVNLDPAVGREIKKRRPCIVLSTNEINRIRATPVVIPLSSSSEKRAPGCPGRGSQRGKRFRRRC